MAPAQLSSLEPADWIRAALERLAKHGIEGVRVELLARDLGVSKGSFYWHFRNRTEMREKMLAAWENSELSWLDGRANSPSMASRWANLIARVSDPEHIHLEVAMQGWARSEEKVARALASIERKRAQLIAEVLNDIGFSWPAAQAWSEVVLLLVLGWMDRAARRAPVDGENRGLGELLSDVILAASARSSLRHEK
ncbi:MAG TPA: helix-turn-helix domain-containing protein [Candidatus Acidoferrales bacterium]|nr:helix-turn-helix domain-containing protein [Candidatus Acidoferrales bacterium]